MLFIVIALLSPVHQCLPTVLNRILLGFVSYDMYVGGGGRIVTFVQHVFLYYCADWACSHRGVTNVFLRHDHFIGLDIWN